MSTKVPVGVVIARKASERLEELGVTDEKVFSVLRDALEADKVIKDKSGEVHINPDWNVRLAAVRLYMEITLVEPKSAKKAMASPLTSMSPEEMITGEMDMDGENILQLPPDRPRTVEEQREWQRKQIELRNTR